MFPYWILFSVASIGAIEDRHGPFRRGAGPIAIFAALAIVLMIGLRYRVGADWYNYQEIFAYYETMSFHEIFNYGDPGYALLNWASHQLGFDIWFVNLLCAGLFVWGLFRFVQAQPNPALALVVAIPYLVIVVAMGYTRQAVAIGLVMAGLANIGKAPLYKFVLYVVAAALFHKSAVIVLPLVALASSRGRLMTGIILAVTALLLYYLLISGAVMDRMMTVYIDAEYNSQGAAVRVLMNVPPALIFLLARNRFGLTPEQERVWVNFSWASFVALLLLFTLASSTAVDRLALYLIPLQLLVFSRLPYAFAPRGGRNGQILMGIIAYYFLIQLVWLYFGDHARYWVPYRLFPFGSEAAAPPPLGGV